MKCSRMTRAGVAAAALLALMALWACQSADRFAAYREQDPLTVDQAPRYCVGQADDNDWCKTCHMDYQAEPLARRHSKAGVGCTRCHGTSERHADDEDAVIPPDKMFARHEVSQSCLPCHQRCSERQVVCVYQPGEPGSMEVESAQCTDCHGSHRLARRSRLWDPNTGKLVWTDGAGGTGAGSGADAGAMGGM